MRLIHKEPIKTFPFGRMSLVMAEVGWKWWLGRTPNGAELQLEASQMLRRVQKSKSIYIGSGGLIVWPDGMVGFEPKSGKNAACKKAWQELAGNSRKLNPP